MSAFTIKASSGGLDGIGYGMIFGFTSFIGFEAAAVLGEETREPRRAIPKAILGAVIFAGVFYILLPTHWIWGSVSITVTCGPGRRPH